MNLPPKRQPSKVFPNTQLWIWDYKIKLNAYWYIASEITGDAQIIYHISIYAN